MIWFAAGFIAGILATLGAQFWILTLPPPWKDDVAENAQKAADPKAGG